MFGRPSVTWRVPFTFARLGDRLLAGSSPLTTQDLDTLLLEGITDILDLRRSVEYVDGPCYHAGQACEERGLRRHHVPMCDDSAPSCTEITTAIRCVREVMADPERGLFVHCRAGVDRAGAVLVAWFACEHDLTFSESLSLLRERRAPLAPTLEQEQAIRRWLKLRA